VRSHLPEKDGDERRALELDAARICKALKARGVVPDFRPPNAIRLAPVPLYTSYHELWQTIHYLRAILDAGEHMALAPGREVVA
jgi:kynureninase